MYIYIYVYIYICIYIYMYIYIYSYRQKCNAIPVQAYYRPRGFQEVKARRFSDSRHTKVVAFTSQEEFLVIVSVRG
jgi:hypothetical protein